MSKIPNPPPFQQEDFAEAPEWFTRWAERMTRHIEEVTRALQKGIGEDNFNSEVVTLELRHNASQVIDATSISGDPQEVRIQQSESPVVGFFWEQTGDKQVTVTGKFDEVVLPVSVKIVVQGS